MGFWREIEQMREPRLPLRPRPGCIRLLMVAGERSRVVELVNTAEHLTPTEMERVFRGQFPEMFEGRRYMMVRLTGQILRADEMCYVDAENAWYAVEMVDQGSAPLPEHAAQARDIRTMIGAKLKLNQIKLLLKGEEGLAQRLHRLRFDPNRSTSVILSAAVRYRMEIAEGEVQATDKPKDEWQEVKTVKPKKKAQDQEKTKQLTKKKETAKQDVKLMVDKPQIKLQLKEGTWPVPILDTFALGKDGVFLGAG